MIFPTTKILPNLQRDETNGKGWTALNTVFDYLNKQKHLPDLL